MYKDIQTAISFTNLSPIRQDRLSTLLSGAERAWRVYDDRQPAGDHTYRSPNGNQRSGQFEASGHAFDVQKASARLLRLGRR